MPKPTEAEVNALPQDLQRQYRQVWANDPDGSKYQRFLFKAQQRLEADQRQAEQQILLDRIKTGDTKDLPPEVLMALDIGETIGSAGMEKDFSRFTPGFGEFITTDAPRTVDTTLQRAAKQKGDVQDLITAAEDDAIKYYLDQGYKSETQLKQDATDYFLKTYGTQDEFIQRQVDAGDARTPETLAFLYGQSYEISTNPPGGYPNSAEAMARLKLRGEVRGDTETFGDLNRPIQPRRYAVFGDMEPVGPRTGGALDQFVGVNPVFPPRGASPVAENFRQNPELARQLSPDQLAREAFRPQVVRSGEERRFEKEAEQRNAALILKEVEDIQKRDGSSLKDATATYVAELEGQIQHMLINEQRIYDKLTPEYIRNYKMSNPYTGISNLFNIGPSGYTNVAEQIVKDMSKQAVVQKFREAGLEVELPAGYKGGLDSPITFGYTGRNALGDAWKLVTEDPTGDQYIQMLKRAGVIDPDAVVESKPMQYARNANMAFRMVFNPLMETMESTADTIDYAITGDETPAMRKGKAEVDFAERTGQKLLSPTYDFTADQEYVNKYGYFNAYLAEAMLETATGRTLGNDIVSWHPEIYYTMKDDPDNMYKGLQFEPDTYVIAGTIFEIGVPVEAPLQVAALGLKGAAKVPSGVRQAYKVGKELGRSSTPLDAIKGGTAGSKEILPSIVQNSKVSTVVAEDASDIILAAERIEDTAKAMDKAGIPIDEQIAIVSSDLGPRGRGTAEVLLRADDAARTVDGTVLQPSEFAARQIDTIANNPDSLPALSSAAQDSVATRGARTGTDKQYARDVQRRARLEAHIDDPNGVPHIDPINERARKVSMQSKVADTLQGEAGLDDFHMLTDRVAVSSDFLNTKVGKNQMAVQLVEDVNGHFGGPLKPQSAGDRLVPDGYFRTHGDAIEGLEFRLGNPAPGQDAMAPVNYHYLLEPQTAQDPLLRRIMQDVRNGKKVSFQDEMYLRQRAMEQMAYIRGAQTNKSMGKKLLSEIPIIRGAVNRQAKPLNPEMFKDFDQFAMTGKSSVPGLQTSDVIEVVPGSTFHEATRVPKSRRSEIGRTAKALTPLVLRNAMNEANAVFRGIRPLGEYGRPLDNALSPIDERMTEAVVSLERQTPLTASRLRKQGFTPQQTEDALFYTSQNGNDYTEFLTLDKSAMRQRFSQEYIEFETKVNLAGNVPSQNPYVRNYYSQLLGNASNDPVTWTTLDRVAADLGGPNGMTMLDSQFTVRVLDEMKAMYAPSLQNVAITPGLRSYDITGVKIAMAADATKGVRMQRVALEVGQQLPMETVHQIEITAKLSGIDPDAYRGILAAHTAHLVEGAGPMTPAKARQILDSHLVIGDPLLQGDVVRNLENLTGNLANSQANALLARKGRMLAKGYDEKAVMDAILTPALQELGGDALKLGKSGEIVSENLKQLRRMEPGLTNLALDRLSYVASPKARLVSGQLGGMLVPNGIYHAENFVTAPLIAAITDPEYVGAVLAQQGRALTMGLVEPSKLAKGQQPLTMGRVSVAKGITSFDNPLTGLQRYVDDSGRIGMYTPAEALEYYRMYNLGNTKASLVLGENFVRDVEYQMKFGGRNFGDYAGAMGEQMKRSMLPGSGTTYGMKMADDTDRMFREAVFFQALKKGNTPEQAAQLAREVLLDYGMMPDAMKQGVGQYFLYMSFQYAMAAETAKALTKPRNARFLIAELNRQRQVSNEIYGQPSIVQYTDANGDKREMKVFGNQADLTDAVLFEQINTMYDKDAAAYYTYYRSPMIGSFKQIAGVLDYVNGAPYSPYFEKVKEAAKEPQKIEKAGLDAVLESAYSPALDLISLLTSDPEFDYKAPVPSKVVYQIAAMDRMDLPLVEIPWMTGENAKILFDLEYVPIEERRPGKAELGGPTRLADGPQRMIVDPATGLAKPESALIKAGIDVEDLMGGGYQLRFKSKEGYRNFMLYQQLMNFSGVGRLANDVTGQLITMGYLPEGTQFGYDEKGTPLLYMPGRQKVVRVPPEWEKYDRQIQMQQQEIRKYLEELK